MNPVTILLLLSLSAVAIAAADGQVGRSDEKDKFGPFKCRADAQEWTLTDFSDKQKAIGMSATGVLVNGQLRLLPDISSGVIVHELEDRATEMEICEQEDADFQKQFNTYVLIERLYREETKSRYVKFLLDHHLLEQFTLKDTKAFK
jgi:hypothetical protein